MFDDFARDNRYQLIVGNSNYNFENEEIKTKLQTELQNELKNIS